jgi:hypothetical protein
MDAGRQMWLWRDWVLAAYRDGMPYDRFLEEQLAGDLLPNATDAQKIASGFNRNHVTTDEGGTIPEEYLVLYTRERTEATSQVWMGLTAGCAVCHDHKFDPISQEDFYRLYAYFDSIDEPGLYSQVTDANRALEPYIEVPRPEQRAALADRARNRGRGEGARRTEPDEDARLAEFRADLAREAKVEWAEASLESAVSPAARITVQEDGSALVSGLNPDKTTTRSSCARRRRASASCASTRRGPEPPGGRVGRSPNGNADLTGVTAEAISTDPGREPVKFVGPGPPRAGGRRLQGREPPRRERRLGWAVDAHHVEGPRVALLLAETPFVRGGRISR